MQISPQSSASVEDNAHHAAAPTTAMTAAPVIHWLLSCLFEIDSDSFIVFTLLSFDVFVIVGIDIACFLSSIIALFIFDSFLIFSFDSLIIILYLFSALILSLFIFVVVTFLPPLMALCVHGAIAVHAPPVITMRIPLRMVRTTWLTAAPLFVERSAASMSSIPAAYFVGSRIFLDSANFHAESNNWSSFSIFSAFIIILFSFFFLNLYPL